MPRLEIQLKDGEEFITEQAAKKHMEDIDILISDYNRKFTGLLCSSHVLRPVAQKTFHDGHWNIEIIACCVPMLFEVKRRITPDEKF